MSQKTKKTFHKRPQHEEETETTLYEGRNEVMELLRAGRTVDKLFVARSERPAWRILSLWRRLPVLL